MADTGSGLKHGDIRGESLSLYIPPRIQYLAGSLSDHLIPVSLDKLEQNVILPKGKKRNCVG